MSLKTPTALIVGSAPISRTLATANLDATARIAINNAWTIRSDFTHAIYPSDFPEERRPGTNLKHVSNSEYMEGFNEAGGIIFGGATMAYAAGYWAVYQKRPWVLGFFGCDMVYEGPQTHFYGQGSADPLRADITLRSLEAKSSRLFLHALTQGTVCVNCSAVANSRLKMPARDLDATAARLFASWKFQRQAMKSPAYPRLMEIFDECKLLESSAPFAALETDYWINTNIPSIEFIDRVDAAWLRAIPLIGILLSNIYMPEALTAKTP